MPDENKTPLRFDAWLREPGAYPFLLGVVTGPTEAEALRTAREALPAFDETKDPAHVELRPENSPRPEPVPARPPGYVEVKTDGPYALRLPPGPMNRARPSVVELGADDVRAVLLPFLRIALDRFDAPAELARRMGELRPDLQIGEVGALDLCEDVAREANRIRARRAELRAEAAAEPEPVRGED